MKLHLSIFIALSLIAVGCGNGVDSITHIGVCDGYTAQAGSLYNLPWPTASEHEVTQGNCSGASHFGDQRYAYDFAFDIGDDIHAARAGEVIEIEESFSDGNGCPDDNHIYIKHDDGTIAAYVHLTNAGALVSVGDTVTQGEHIADSGNTGCSSGPHLHFVVWADSSKTETVPVNFKNTSSNSRGLIRGKTYTAN